MANEAQLLKDAEKSRDVAEQTAYNARMESSRPATRGQATYFNRSQYGNIGNYMYPSDLMDPTNQYGGNFVIFYINVHEDSYLFREGKIQEVEGNIPTRTQGYLAGQQINEDATKKSAVMVGALSGGTAGVVASALGGVNLSSSGAAGAIIGAGAAFLTVEEIGKVKAQYKQIKDAIALHIPLDMNVRYGVQWDPENMAGAGALFGMGENLLNAVTQFGSDKAGAMDNSINELKAGFRTASSYLTGAVIDGTPVGQAMGKLSGIASNPKKEQIFRQVDFRTFTFTYQFFSKSPEEAQQVRNIIKLFKLHMHPEFKKNSGNFLYLYPSEFDIYYYNAGKENMNLHRHTSCVLTDMAINYAPNNSFTSFADGMPTQINVTLTFKELATLTKELVEDGF